MKATLGTGVRSTLCHYLPTAVTRPHRRTDDPAEASGDALQRVENAEQATIHSSPEPLLAREHPTTATYIAASNADSSRMTVAR